MRRCPTRAHLIASPTATPWNAWTCATRSRRCPGARAFLQNLLQNMLVPADIGNKLRQLAVLLLKQPQFAHAEPAVELLPTGEHLLRNPDPPDRFDTGVPSPPASTRMQSARPCNATSSSSSLPRRLHNAEKLSLKTNEKQRGVIQRSSLQSSRSRRSVSHAVAQTRIAVRHRGRTWLLYPARFSGHQGRTHRLGGRECTVTTTIALRHR